MYVVVYLMFHDTASTEAEKRVFAWWKAPANLPHISHKSTHTVFFSLSHTDANLSPIYAGLCSSASISTWPQQKSAVTQ